MNDHGMPPRPEPPSPEHTLLIVAQNQVEIARILKWTALGYGILLALLFLLLSVRFLADATRWCP